MANSSTPIALCTSVETQCQPCYLGASTVLASFPYAATTTIIIDVIPNISQLPDGRNTTSFVTLSQTDIGFVGNETNSDLTIEEGSPLTWTTQGVVLTYPTTYAYVNEFSGAASSNPSSIAPSCAQVSNVESLALQTTTPPSQLFVPLGEAFQTSNESLVSIPSPVLDYLEAFQTEWPGFGSQELGSCLQYNAESTLPASITGGVTPHPCSSTSSNVVVTCLSQNYSSCTTLVSFVTTVVGSTFSEATLTTELPAVTLPTATILSRRTGAPVFTPPPVPVDVSNAATQPSPPPTSAVPVQNDPTEGPVQEEDGTTPAPTDGTPNTGTIAPAPTSAGNDDNPVPPGPQPTGNQQPNNSPTRGAIASYIISIFQPDASLPNAGPSAPGSVVATADPGPTTGGEGLGQSVSPSVTASEAPSPSQSLPVYTGQGSRFDVQISIQLLVVLFGVAILL